MRLDGSSVLLTGASGGLGHALARALARAGASLVLTGRRQEALSALAAELSARSVVADLADRVALEELMAVASGVDVLVANAAVPATGDLLGLGVEAIDRAIDVNLRAPMVMARVLGAAMAKRGRGHIVLVGSLSGKAATPASALYSATKFGLRGFAHGLRMDLEGTGVGVSTVLPGFVRDAGMFADSGARLPWPVGTVSPGEVAAAVVRAVEHNRAEVVVAPAVLRLAAAFAGLAPGPAGAMQRILSVRRTAARVARGQAAARPDR